MTTTNLSVVGSGPIWAPDISNSESTHQLNYAPVQLANKNVEIVADQDNQISEDALWMLFFQLSTDPKAWSLACNWNHCLSDRKKKTNEEFYLNIKD